VKKVIIEAIDSNTMEWEKIGSVLLSEDGVVSFEGLNERAIREYYDFGVVGRGKDGPLFPKDGAAFMDALYLECNRCSMVRAVDAAMARRDRWGVAPPPAT
jgi:hypothetical protein